MEQDLKSEGKCLFCGQMLAQRGIGRHLAGHLKKTEEEGTGKRPDIYCHVEVKAGEMFLHLLVRGAVTMRRIDEFLRDIWLDCCDHLSDFGHDDYEVRMNQRVADVLQPKVRLFHDYDYGSTTRVFLRAGAHYALDLDEDILLLSRNEPLKILCATCKKKPAVYICTVCWWEKEALYCADCSEKHAQTCDDFEDYARMPVVNSPRMGVCGYTGGVIDVERDGPYTNQ